MCARPRSCDSCCLCPRLINRGCDSIPPPKRQAFKDGGRTAGLAALESSSARHYLGAQFAENGELAGRLAYTLGINPVSPSWEAVKCKLGRGDGMVLAEAMHDEPHLTLTWHD